MEKKKLVALGLLSATALTTNVYAEELVYGEDIPAGEEDEYVFVENETQEDAYTNLSNEEANSLKIELEASGYTTVTIKSYDVNNEVTNTIEKEFESEEEALAYIDELKNQGLTVENVEFINNTDTENGSVTETYDTLEEAQVALEAFTSEYSDNVTSNIEKIRDEQEDTDESFTETFDNVDEANNYYDEKMALANEDVDVIATKETNESDGETITLNEVYSTLDNANNRVEELANEYDVVESTNVEEKIGGTVYNCVKLTAYESEYEMDDSLFIIIRHGNEVLVWTPNELTSEEIAVFKRTYPDFQVDQTISVDNATFIHGLNNEFFTSNDKPFEIIERDGKIVAIMSPGSVSHAVYGEFQDETEYHLTALVHNKIYSYTVSGNIYTRGYDYKLSAAGSKEVTLNSGKLKATTKETKKETMYALDLVRSKYEFMGGIGGDDLNPQTNDETLWVFTIGGISLIGAASTGLNLRKKEEN